MHGLRNARRKSYLIPASFVYYQATDYVRNAQEFKPLTVSSRDKWQPTSGVAAGPREVSHTLASDYYGGTVQEVGPIKEGRCILAAFFGNHMNTTALIVIVVVLVI